MTTTLISLALLSQVKEPNRFSKESLPINVQQKIDTAVALVFRLNKIGRQDLGTKFKFTPESLQKVLKENALTFWDNGGHLTLATTPDALLGFPYPDFAFNGDLERIGRWHSVSEEKKGFPSVAKAELIESAKQGIAIFLESMPGFSAEVGEPERLTYNSTEWVFNVQLKVGKYPVGTGIWARIGVTDYSAQINGINFYGHPKNIEPATLQKSEDEIQGRAASSILSLNQVDQVSMSEHRGQYYWGGSFVKGSLFKDSPRVRDIVKNQKLVLTNQYVFGDFTFPQRYRVIADARTGETLQVVALVPLGGVAPSGRGLAEPEGDNLSGLVLDGASSKPRKMNLRLAPSQGAPSKPGKPLTIKIEKNYWKAELLKGNLIRIGKKQFTITGRK